MPVIMVVSNGHGEDLVGAKIALELRRAVGDDRVVAFPLVGPGQPYVQQGIRTVGEPQLVPSGGFARTGLKPLVSDIKAGLVRCLFRQIGEMRLVSSSVSLTICVGDVFLLVLCALGHLPRRLLIATAKSEYISGHLAIEALSMRKLAETVLPRDEPTAESLHRKGVPVLFVGNFLMDVINRSCEPLPCPVKGHLVCLLPGSRADFPANLCDILRCLAALPDPGGMTFVAALSRVPEGQAMNAALPGPAWSFRPRMTSSKQGYVGDVVLSDEAGGARLSVAVVAGRFGDLVASCDLVVGMAGTADEQAAGLGKPVVTLPGRGAQFTSAFARAQKRLLGDAICLVESADPREVAREIHSILSDPSRYSYMSEAGVARMGPPGAVARLVEHIRSMDGVF